MEGNLYEHCHINMDAYCKPYPSSHLVNLLVESHPSLPLDCLQGQSLVQLTTCLVSQTLPFLLSLSFGPLVSDLLIE
jgi:hypothetical protein